MARNFIILFIASAIFMTICSSAVVKPHNLLIAPRRGGLKRVGKQIAKAIGKQFAKQTLKAAQNQQNQQWNLSFAFRRDTTDVANSI